MVTPLNLAISLATSVHVDSSRNMVVLPWEPCTIVSRSNVCMVTKSLYPRGINISITWSTPFLTVIYGHDVVRRGGRRVKT